MVIGIDVTPLQNPHALRGIGSVVRGIIKHIPSGQKAASFIFYVDNLETAQEDIGQLIPSGISYAFHKHPGSRLQNNIENHPGESIATKILRKIRHFASLVQQELPLPEGNSLDIYLQFDPNVALPRTSRHTEVRLFIHDLIPYVLEKDYLWNYRTSRRNGLSRKAGINRHFLRWSYAHVLKKNCSRAVKIFSNSQHTKDDFVKYLAVDETKIAVTHLGVEEPADLLSTKPPKHHYVLSEWGTVKQPIDSTKHKPFLLFAGGADPRRKLKDLFAAYNNLRARGIEISLLLAGDTMMGLKDLPNKEARRYLLANRSYIEDVFFLGHVSSEQLAWLYTNATAFVFPSTYEGFGLPVIEAAVRGTPVITYRNSSLQELKHSSVFYAEDYLDITEKTIDIMQGHSEPTRAVSSSRLLKSFNWASIAKQIFQA